MRVTCDDQFVGAMRPPNIVRAEGNSNGVRPFGEYVGGWIAFVEENFILGRYSQSYLGSGGREGDAIWERQEERSEGVREDSFIVG